MGKKTDKKRYQKFFPLSIGKIKGQPRIAIYLWSNSPVELWIWDVGPKPSRIELHGLERYPSLKELEPALAFLAMMRETQRREHGTLGGPGRKTYKEYDELFEQFEMFKQDKPAARELLSHFIGDQKDDAEERTKQAIRRRKRKQSK